MVISVMVEADSVRLRVAYGTSRRVTPLRRGEFHITPDDGDAFIQAGLSYPTKFSLTGTVVLPSVADWFAIPPAKPHGACCKLGSLHSALLRRVQEAAKSAGLV